MKFNIYILQKKAEPLYKKAMDEYLKRLQAYGNVKVHYVKNEKQAQKTEKAAAVNYRIVPDRYSLTSPELAERIQEMSVGGVTGVNFFIGDFPEEDKEAFSLSSFTMNQSLTAVVLLEQIYRAYRIMNHQPYHK